MSSGFKIPIHKSISSILLGLLTCIGLIVLVGLTILSIRLNGIQQELRELQKTGLPRLVKISQLSQEASASIAVAPALSANPTRFEFETFDLQIIFAEVKLRFGQSTLMNRSRSRCVSHVA